MGTLKKNKSLRVILPCYGNGDSGTYDLDYAIVEFDKDYLKFLLQLRDAFQAMNVAAKHDQQVGDLYMIEFFDYAPDFYSSLKVDHLGPPSADNEEHVVLRQDQRSPGPGEGERVDAPTLQVVRDGIRWAAYAKHCDRLVTTAHLFWDDVEAILKQLKR